MYAKRAVLTVAIVILVVEGYFVYRWYDRYYLDPAASNDAGFSASRPITSASDVRNPPVTTPETTAEEATVVKSEAITPEATVKEPKNKTEFIHRATPENIADNSTYVHNPLADDNPSAILLAKRIGESGGAVFIHRATTRNTVENHTYINHPLANGNPDANLSIRPNWNPGGGAGTYNDHPVRVRYDADRVRWLILNQDRASIPEGAAFNVVVSDGVPPTN